LVPRTPGRSRPPTLEHDVGGLAPRRGQGPRLESELADGLRGDEGDHPVRAALDLDLRHHRVGADSRDQAPEAVSGAHGAVAVACALPPALALALALGVAVAAGARGRPRLGAVLGHASELGTVDRPAAGVVRVRGEGAAVDPAWHGVVTDPEERG